MKHKLLTRQKYNEQMEFSSSKKGFHTTRTMEEEVLPEASSALPEAFSSAEQDSYQSEDMAGTTAVSTDISRGISPHEELLERPLTPSTDTSEQSGSSIRSGPGSGRGTPHSHSDLSLSVSSSEKGTPGRKRKLSSSSARQIEFDNLSTSSGSIKITKFPHRPGIQWKKGEKVEAMDFMKKWYVAKFIDLNEEDMQVLIHFEGWNQRYDEWLDMASDRLRPLTRHSGRKEKGRKKFKSEHKLGEQVYAKWTDCKMYPAKITSVNSDGSYEVVFYDGFKRIVQPINIRPMPKELQQQKFAITPVPIEDVKKAKMNLDDLASVPLLKTSPGGSSVVEPSTSTGEPDQNTKDFEPFLLKKDIKKVVIIKQNRDKKKEEKRKERRTSEKEDPGRKLKSKKLLVAGSLFKPGRSKSLEESDIRSGQTKPMEERDIKGGRSRSVESSMVKIAEEPVATVTEIKTESSEQASETPVEQEPVAEQVNLDLVKPVAIVTTSIVTSSTESHSSLSVPSSPAESVSSEKRTRKRNSSPCVSEASSESTIDTPDRAHRRRRTKSLEKDRHVPFPAVPPKAFVVEKDHNHFKCMFAGCNKSFRKEHLLEYHIKYYHVDDGKSTKPAVPRKRRKTTSVCSTDSEQSVSSKRTPVSKKHRHKSSESSASLASPPLPIKVEPEEVIIVPDGTPEKVTPNKDTEEMGTQTAIKMEPPVKVELEKEEPVKVEPVKHERTGSQDTVCTEDSNVTEDEELEKDEVVNCMCGVNEENGLMVQCDVCLCWQHAACFELTADSLPQKYVCYVCENPPGVRESSRYICEQDWLREGQIPAFSFLPRSQHDGERSRVLKSTNELIADIHNLTAVLHGLKRQLKILRFNRKDPEFQLWSKDWDTEEPEGETEMDEQFEEDIDMDISDPSQTLSLDLQENVLNRDGLPEVASNVEIEEKLPVDDCNRKDKDVERLGATEETSPSTSREESGVNIAIPDEGCEHSSITAEGTQSSAQSKEGAHFLDQRGDGGHISTRDEDGAHHSDQREDTAHCLLSEGSHQEKDQKKDGALSSAGITDASSRNETDVQAFGQSTNSGTSSDLGTGNDVKQETQDTKLNGYDSTEVKNIIKPTLCAAVSAEEREKGGDESEKTGSGSVQERPQSHNEPVPSCSKEADEPEIICVSDEEPEMIAEVSGGLSSTIGDEICKGKVQTVTEEVEEVQDTTATCEMNLLQHILRVQAEINARLDFIEEQVCVLEAIDAGKVLRPSNPEDIMADMPVLKRSVRSVTSDLNKVKKMAMMCST